MQQLYLKLNNKENAILEFRKALSLDPNMTDLKNFISELEREK